MESKDDPELRRLAKLEAIRKAEQDEIAEESSEINNLTKNLKKKTKKEEPS
jgi:Skp family chaperone for outer membrane proteins